MSTKILVAVSANSADTVLASAIELARRYDASIVALHVVDTRPVYLGACDYCYGPVVDALEQHGQDTVARIKEALADSHCEAETRLVTLPLVGMTVGAVIASLAQESAADMIVLGERSPGWWRCLSENVATEVRRHTATPMHLISSQPTKRPASHSGTRWSSAATASTH